MRAGQITNMILQRLQVLYRFVQKYKLFLNRENVGAQK